MLEPMHLIGLLVLASESPRKILNCFGEADILFTVARVSLQRWRKTVIFWPCFIFFYFPP